MKCVYQINESYNFAACVKMIASKFHSELNIEEIQAFYSGKILNQERIKLIFKHYGFNARVFCCRNKIDFFKEVKNQNIELSYVFSIFNEGNNYNHFVVYDKIKKKQIIVCDPAYKNKRNIDLTLFSNMWNGILICIEKVENYKPIKYKVKFPKKLINIDTSSIKNPYPELFNQNITISEMSEKMGFGINLGNTFDSTRNYFESTNNSPEYYEQQWGQIRTSQSLINAYKQSGFNSIRIPIAWMNSIEFERGNFIIYKEYLDRIEVVVNYALQAGLFVIINDHWDMNWWSMFGAQDYKIRKAAYILYKSMWIQIANRFKNYDEHLLFEGGNEELGDSLNKKNLFSKNAVYHRKEELYKIVNKINQCFVDTIRNTKGNNLYRFLIIPGFNTNIGDTLDKRFKMPKDLEKRLFISVHYYTPSDFCIFNKIQKWNFETEWKNIEAELLCMNKFKEEGYGVFIGEYGVILDNNKDIKQGAREWIMCVINYCRKFGFVSCLWDCNTYFDKIKMKIKDDFLSNLFIKY